MNDTANEIASLDECLKSTINRARIALLLWDQGEGALIWTALEDLDRGCQDIIDHCVVKDEQANSV